MTIKKYLISKIDLNDYDMENTVENAATVFYQEMGWSIKRRGLQTTCEDWLRRLASALTVDFYNLEIVELCKENDWFPALNKSRFNEDVLVVRFWKSCAYKLALMFEPHIEAIQQAERERIEAEKMTITEALESYINGNIKTVKKWIKEENYDLGGFLEQLGNTHDLSESDLILAVKRLA